MKETIVCNGVIRTMRTESERFEALLIKGNRIHSVGTNDDILSYRTSATEVIDLRGALLLPGFIDSHLHMITTGILKTRIDFRGAQSVDELIERGRAFIAQRAIPEGEWISGFGFDETLFPDGRFPDKTIGDMITKTHPLYVDRFCGHAGFANSLALNKGKVTSRTRIEGGRIDNDANGEPNGILRETALWHIKYLLPANSAQEIECIIGAIGRDFLKTGLTSVHSNDMGGNAHPETLAIFRALSARGALPVRVFEEIKTPTMERLMQCIGEGNRTGAGDAFFKIGNAKLFVDGALGAHSAALLDDYSDMPGNRGTFMYTEEALAALVATAHDNDMQVALHAIGDAGIERAVNAIERAVTNNPKDLRHRIVHCQTGNRALYQRMANLGIGADIQPAFLLSDYRIAEKRLGHARAKESYAWKTLLRLGVVCGGGSDSPITEYNPLRGIHAAVTRCDEDGWVPEERLSVYEAVSLYTKHPAYLAFEEGEKGTIAPGYLADLVALSKDIFTLPYEEILSAKATLAFVDGVLRYSGD